MIHIGRYTSALMLIATGFALVMDQTSDTRYIRMLIDWWPLVFILLGAEVIILSMLYRNRDTKLRFSFNSVFGAALIAVVVMLFTNFGEEKFDKDNWRFWESIFQGVEMPVERFVVDNETEIIRILNKNGDVIIQPSDSKQLEIQTELKFSNFISEEQARKIAENSEVVVKPGRTLQIEAKGERYRHIFWKQEATMNLTISIPRDRLFDYQLELSNGDVHIDGVDVRNNQTVRTSNGDVEIRHSSGKVNVSTSNGDIDLLAIDGDVSVQTSNGDVVVTDITGTIIAQTTNGDIEVSSVPEDLQLRTTNGDVVVRSTTVAGSWRIDTNNGDIVLTVPEVGDYRIRGKGDITTSIPWLEVKRNRVEGELGSGLYAIEAETNIGDLIISLSP